MDWSQVLTIVWSAVGIIITSFASWLTTLIIKWLNSKIKDKQLAKWSTELTLIVMNAVKEVFQTYVESLKKEGAFTAEKQKEALAKCLAIIEGSLSTELKDYIVNNYGDMEAYLKTLIESTIYSLKNDNKKEIVQ